MDLGSPIQMIDTTKVDWAIPILEMFNKSFLYGFVQNGNNHLATFSDSLNFNEINWETIQSDQSYWNMQLLQGYDSKDFPFVIALNQLKNQIFVVNTHTKIRIPLISFI